MVMRTKPAHKNLKKLGLFPNPLAIAQLVSNTTNTPYNTTAREPVLRAFSPTAIFVRRLFFRVCEALALATCSRELLSNGVPSSRGPRAAGPGQVLEKQLMVLLLLLLLAGGQAAPLPSCENALPPGEGFGGSVTITSDCTWRPQLHFISTLTGQQRPDYPGALTTPTIFFESAAVNSQAGKLRQL